ncbi:MAG: hypothetical protein WC356_04630 [Candidatus Micrarchaeia archaeon]|jgi:hypothetical protein
MKKQMFEVTVKSSRQPEVPQSLFADLLKANLTGAGYKIALSILANTIGAGRSFTRVSLYDMGEFALLSTAAVSVALTSLEDARIITVVRPGPGVANLYAINFNTAQWQSRREGARRRIGAPNESTTTIIIRRK